MQFPTGPLLWQSIFPRLKILIVEEWWYWPEDVEFVEVGNFLKGFLLSHPNLLISNSGRGTFSTATFVGVQGRLGFTSLCTNINALHPVLTEAPHTDWVGTLRELEVARAGSSLVFLMELLTHLVVEIENAFEIDEPVFRSLQVLTIGQSPNFEFEEDEEWKVRDADKMAKVVDGIYDFGRLCGPELRSLTVYLPFMAFSIEDLAAFHSYPQVEEITIIGGLLTGDRHEEKYAIAAEAIALECKNLQKLTFIRADEYGNQLDESLTVQRRIGGSFRLL